MIDYKKTLLLCILSFSLCATIVVAKGKHAKQTNNLQRKSIQLVSKRLMDCYPDFITGYKGNNIIWKDATAMPFAGTTKPDDYNRLLTNPCLADQFLQKYPKGKMKTNPEKNQDPGRIRYEPFFYKMYGKTEDKVKKNLVTITWCPKLCGQKILVTKINGIDKKVKAISKELDRHPELKKYLTQIGGTFNWRTINGTNRQSTHSFGTTIDLNIKYSNYWQWDCKCTNEDTDDLIYKNQIPQIIIAIFEKNGFIWGGKWYHYDSMHFEYRPELL